MLSLDFVIGMTYIFISLLMNREVSKTRFCGLDYYNYEERVIVITIIPNDIDNIIVIKSSRIYYHQHDVVD